MAVSIDMDTGNPDQNLANAIILQAATDYRKARAFLREHPRTKKLERQVKTIQETNKGKPGRNHSPEEKLLHRIKNAENATRECEAFFKSRWFSTLCDLDGKELFEKLRKEADDEDGTCEGLASETEAADDGVLGDFDILSWL